MRLCSRTTRTLRMHGARDEFIVYRSIYMYQRISPRYTYITYIKRERENYILRIFSQNKKCNNYLNLKGIIDNNNKHVRSIKYI